MLLLTRREGENIRIGDAIQVQVLSVSEGAVRIQIDAPDFVEVREVSDRKQGPTITHKRRRLLVTRSESR
ncbi:carbon storage regulator [Pseudomonas coronafaciens]|uniref:carbon storage regulator n=1 Tax=Pseudomonas coronafaciens TaxID=53409 RepID=UPI000E3D4B16|nr:carbon storage regulator [Pseudomonas coronafaciens]